MDYPINLLVSLDWCNLEVNRHIMYLCSGQSLLCENKSCLEYVRNNLNNYVLCILEAAFLRFFVIDIFEVLKLKKIYFNLTKTRLIM